MYLSVSFRAQQSQAKCPFPTASTRPTGAARNKLVDENWVCFVKLGVVKWLDGIYETAVNSNLEGKLYDRSYACCS